MDSSDEKKKDQNVDSHVKSDLSSSKSTFKMRKIDAKKTDDPGNNIQQYDRRTVRCRMLGHELPFEYCRKGQGGIPCQKVLDCWHEILAIEDFIREFYTPEQIEEILKPVKPKMASLLDLIQKAKESDKM